MSTLMVSISGIRGIVGNGLDPEVIVKYTSAYADFIGKGNVVVGRDARITGEMVNQIVTGTLLAKGLDVTDIGICPTPTVQYTVKKLNAKGGIAISASHNPNEWNALKLLNETGQFMSPDEHTVMMKMLEEKNQSYKPWNGIGKRNLYTDALNEHLEAVLKIAIINKEKIKSEKFRVVVDCVNGAGVYIIPQLLRELGCEVIEMNCEKTGIFPRLPEPLPENLLETMKKVKDENADLGIVVDPDVDRLVLITDEGLPFIEENTITLASKFVISKMRGDVVVNLSTTRAIDVIAQEAGVSVKRSPVGEANVVKLMKETKAVIGGEGSGGVIFPSLHYGRDALVGIVLILQFLAESGKKLSQVKAELPEFYIAKKKVDLINVNPDNVISKLGEINKDGKRNFDDGLRIDFDDHWVHFRKSNTEPIIRIITEAETKQKSEAYAEKYFSQIKSLM